MRNFDEGFDTDRLAYDAATMDVTIAAICVGISCIILSVFWYLLG